MKLQRQLSLVHQKPTDVISTAGEDLPDVAEEPELVFDPFATTGVSFLKILSTSYADVHVERTIESLSMCSFSGGRKIREHSFKMLKRDVEREQGKRLQADIDRLSIKKSFVRKNRPTGVDSDHEHSWDSQSAPGTPVHIAIPYDATLPEFRTNPGDVIVKRKSKNCIIC